MQQHARENDTVPKEPESARSAPSLSEGTPLPIDGDTAGAVDYDDLFGTPALPDADTDRPDRSHIDARVAGRQCARELVRKHGDDPQSLMAGIRQGMRIQYGIKEIRESGGESR